MKDQSKTSTRGNEARIYDAQLKRLKTCLKPVADFINLNYDDDAFSIVFARIFASDSPNYDVGNGMTGATRSNWTYHTAGAMTQTAKVFGYHCKFECNGKRDAIIESGDGSNENCLVAEWEWDYVDIFGKGKELEKLRNSCRANSTWNAFLLTYAPVNDFEEFLFRIVTFWQRSFSKLTADGPVLYLHTILFTPRSSFREFDRLSTIAIHGTQVWLMSDLPL